MHADDNNFNRLLSRLEPDMEDATARYKQLRTKLIKFFAWRRCQDPEGLADETISRTAKNLGKGEDIRSETPYSYIYAIGKNVYREYRRGIKKADTISIRLLESRQAPNEDREDCRGYCLKNLSLDKQKLLREYYLGEKSREVLAQSLNLSINALRLKVHRLKSELKSCYEDCVKRLLEK